MKTRDKKSVLTLAQLKRHIRKCHKKEERFNFLGVVEARDLTPEVQNLFVFSTYTGVPVYDWVRGNYKLKSLIENETK